LCRSESCKNRKTGTSVDGFVYDKTKIKTCRQFVELPLNTQNSCQKYENKDTLRQTQANLNFPVAFRSLIGKHGHINLLTVRTTVKKMPHRWMLNSLKCTFAFTVIHWKQNTIRTPPQCFTLLV